MFEFVSEVVVKVEAAVVIGIVFVKVEVVVTVEVVVVFGIVFVPVVVVVVVVFVVVVLIFVVALGIVHYLILAAILAERMDIPVVAEMIAFEQTRYFQLRATPCGDTSHCYISELEIY